jgi:hypothetical protein
LHFFTLTSNVHTLLHIYIIYSLPYISTSLSGFTRYYNYVYGIHKSTLPYLYVQYSLTRVYICILYHIHVRLHYPVRMHFTFVLLIYILTVHSTTSGLGSILIYRRMSRISSLAPGIIFTHIGRFRFI